MQTYSPPASNNQTGQNTHTYRGNIQASTQAIHTYTQITRTHTEREISRRADREKHIHTYIHTLHTYTQKGRHTHTGININRRARSPMRLTSQPKPARYTYTARGTGVQGYIHKYIQQAYIHTCIHKYRHKVVLTENAYIHTYKIAKTIQAGRQAGRQTSTQ